jgi:ubiquitin-protein ligase
MGGSPADSAACCLLPAICNSACLAPLQILLGLQELLHTPNNQSPAQEEAYKLLKESPAAYNKWVLFVQV